MFHRSVMRIAILKGVNNTTGLGLVEVYGLPSPVPTKLTNISTLGRVQAGDMPRIISTQPFPCEQLMGNQMVSGQMFSKQRFFAEGNRNPISRSENFWQMAFCPRISESRLTTPNACSTFKGLPNVTARCDVQLPEVMLQTSERPPFRRGNR